MNSIISFKNMNMSAKNDSPRMPSVSAVRYWHFNGRMKARINLGFLPVRLARYCSLSHDISTWLIAFSVLSRSGI